MKNTFALFNTFLLIAGLCLSHKATAQSPEKISYQAVVRNSSENLVVNQSVGMQISILQSSASGTAVYVETQTPTTNANGLVSIEIGGGTVISGDFSSIEWANNTYFIKTEMDPEGGTSYSISGTSQMLSVPYALHAKTAETIAGGITETDPVYTASEAANITATDINNLGNLSGTNTGDQDISGIAANTQAIQDTASQLHLALADTASALRQYIDDNTGGDSHYVGEVFGGGVIFYIDHTSNYGLIVSLDNVSPSYAPWGQYGTLINATSTWNGAANSDTIAVNAAPGDAVLLAQAHNGGNNSDWYLPSIDELNLLFNARYLVNKALSTAAGATEILQDNYWSSSERSTTGAYFYNFTEAKTVSSSKNATTKIRAIRAFNY